MTLSLEHATAWAAGEAAHLLQGDRLAHVFGVAKSVRETARRLALPARMKNLLVAASYLHDIGYAPALFMTGFHPLDGAYHVLEVTGSACLSSLVAHHSCAIVEARLRGLDGALVNFQAPPRICADVLTHGDMTVGPSGHAETVQDRLSGIRLRYGDAHVVSKAITLAEAELVGSVQRTEELIRAADKNQRRTA